jgi:putative Mn2+ efflux pump MntP
MSFLELLLVGIGLSMDACAVAICQGLCMPKLNLRHAGVIGLFFGGFQGLMPAIGYFLGNFFADMVSQYAHWVAFILLAIIGGNMIKESFEKEECDCCGDAAMDAKTMFVMAIATSIDALAVGVSFAVLSVDIWSAVTIIGITTFILSVVGLKIGNIFGSRYKNKAEFLGGAILLTLGVKILIEHTCL